MFSKGLLEKSIFAFLAVIGAFSSSFHSIFFPLLFLFFFLCAVNIKYKIKRPSPCYLPGSVSGGGEQRDRRAQCCGKGRRQRWHRSKGRKEPPFPSIILFYFYFIVLYFFRGGECRSRARKYIKQHSEVAAPGGLRPQWEQSSALLPLHAAAPRGGGGGVGGGAGGGGGNNPGGS